MEYHEVANLFPLMQGEEYEQLKADIAANGLLEPIWTHQGKIIDGRNRYRACVELGVSPAFRQWDGNGSLVAFVVSLNLKRRHLTSSQKAVVALEVEKALAVEARERQGTRVDLLQNSQNFSQIFEKSSGPIHAAPEAAAIVGTNRQYVHDAKRIARDAPELLGEVRTGTLTIPEAKALARLPEVQRASAVNKIVTGEAKNAKEAKKAVRHEEAAKQGESAVLPADVSILCGDFRECTANIPDESVDLIFTDPPYDAESIPLYGDLARLGARVLKPGGSLIAYAGHYSIPRILELMQPHLRFWWVLAVKHNGGLSSLTGKKVYVQWKPLLWFVKDRHGGEEFVFDLIESDPPAKDLHDWQQGFKEAEYYIERLAPPGGTVLDPMCGSATTCIAAIRHNRRAIGIERDAAIASRARHRVAIHESVP